MNAMANWLTKTCLKCGKEFKFRPSPSRLDGIRGKYCSHACRCSAVFGTHRNRRSRSYGTWNGMLERCRNPKALSYPRYGGRGIRVCERWRKYENFVADMGEPGDGMSLDRIDPNGNYEPGNCRWATVREQSLNKRNTRRFLFRGAMLTLKEISEMTGVAAITLQYRLLQKWPDEMVASPPSSKPLSFRLSKTSSPPLSV